MRNVARYDRGEVHGDARITDEGYVRANAVVTRTGVFKYQNADGSVRSELRHPDDVWDEESIESMKLIPVTNNHPLERLLTAENSKRLAVGFTGETINKKDNLVLANVVVTDHEAINHILNHGRKELSLGYTVDVEEEEGTYEGEKYNARQRNIRYNHLALVDKARAGSEARIALDSQDAFEVITENKELSQMAKRKIKIDNEEVIVDESTASYIDRLEEDLRNLRDEKARVDREIREMQDKLDKAEAERDAMSDMDKDRMRDRDRDEDSDRRRESALEKKAMKEGQVYMALDSSEFKKAVAERTKLLKVAAEHLDSSEISNIENYDNQKIMKSIIAKARKSVNLDGKSDVYVQAMYDTILDEKSRSVNLDNVSFTSRTDSNTHLSDIEKSRLKMMDNLANKSKGAK